MIAARAALAVALCVLAARPADAGHARVSGTSEPAARRDAQRLIPYQRLNAAARAKVDAVLSKVTVFRRMPTQVVRCDPKLYQFMTTHPDVTVNLWRVLGITNVSLARIGDGKFLADDKSGTRSHLEYLYADHDTLLVYAVGGYQGPLFPQPAKGGCLMLLKTAAIRDADGCFYVTARLDAFFRVDHLGAELVTKTFESLVAKSADQNFKDTMRFLEDLSRAAEIRPRTVKKLAASLTGVRPQDRLRFAQLTAQIAARGRNAQVRRASHEEQAPTK